MIQISKFIALFAFFWVGHRALAVVPVSPEKGPQAVLRLGDAPEMLRLDPKGRFLAFRQGEVLKVLDLKDSSVHRVGVVPTGPAYTWAPDGFRLIYLDTKANSKTTATNIEIFDAALAATKTIRTLDSATGYPTMDARTLGAYVFTPAGLTAVKLDFPDDRLAKWQIAHRNHGKGKYVATAGGMLWFESGDSKGSDPAKMTRLEDDGSALESFSMSPDGSAVAWATVEGYVYRSIDGASPELVDRGRDPAWHPEKGELLYAGARMSGNKIAGYDLKVAGSRDKRFITNTAYSDERWPQWDKAAKRIFHTVARTTDIFMIDQEP